MMPKLTNEHLNHRLPCVRWLRRFLFTVMLTGCVWNPSVYAGGAVEVTIQSPEGADSTLWIGESITLLGKYNDTGGSDETESAGWRWWISGEPKPVDYGGSASGESTYLFPADKKGSFTINAQKDNGHDEPRGSKTLTVKVPKVTLKVTKINDDGTPGDDEVESYGFSTQGVLNATLESEEEGKGISFFKQTKEFGSDEWLPELPPVENWTVVSTAEEGIATALSPLLPAQSFRYHVSYFDETDVKEVIFVPGDLTVEAYSTKADGSLGHKLSATKPVAVGDIVSFKVSFEQPETTPFKSGVELIYHKTIVRQDGDAWPVYVEHPTAGPLQRSANTWTPTSTDNFFIVPQLMEAEQDYGLFAWINIPKSSDAGHFYQDEEPNADARVSAVAAVRTETWDLGPQYDLQDILDQFPDTALTEITPPEAGIFEDAFDGLVTSLQGGEEVTVKDLAAAVIGPLVSGAKAAIGAGIEDVTKLNASNEWIFTDSDAPHVYIEPNVFKVEPGGGIEDVALEVTNTVPQDGNKTKIVNLQLNFSAKIDLTAFGFVASAEYGGSERFHNFQIIAGQGTLEEGGDE